MPDSTDEYVFNTYAAALHYAVEHDPASIDGYKEFTEKRQHVHTAIADIERMRQEHLLDPDLFGPRHDDDASDDILADQRFPMDISGNLFVEIS